MPPNATLIKAMYNSRQRIEVELEWQVQSEEHGGWTGFLLEHRWVSERPGRRSSSNDSKDEAEDRIGPPAWYRNFLQDPDVRSHTVIRLTPTTTYQFRVTPLNHRTIGHPSAPKTPGIVRKHSEENVVNWAKTGAVVGDSFTNQWFKNSMLSLLLLWLW